MIPIAEPNLSGREAQYLRECVETNFVSSIGPFVDLFEQHVSKATCASRAFATSSGTAGLHASLAALNVQAGDLVIAPTFTFIATGNAVAQCGAIPWLLDIEPDSWTLSVECLTAELQKHCKIRDGVVVHEESGRRVSAIVAVYTLGAPADMDAINEVAGEWGLPVVADAACAIGARYHDKNIGSCADLSVASFNGNKTITCGGGGAVFGNDDDLIDRVRHLSTTARVGNAYEHDESGFNYRMTNVQAALGCAQFEQLDDFLLAKRRIHESYVELTTNCRDVQPFGSPKWGDSAHWFSGIVLASATRAHEVQAALQSQGIDARPFWKPLHLQKPYAKSPRSDVVNAEQVWNRIVVLPSSTGITESDLQYVHQCVADLLAGNQ